MKIRLRQLALLGTVLGGSVLLAQTPPMPDSSIPEETIVSSVVIQPATPPCARPAAVFDVDDYNGPLSGLVARISQRIEVQTVHVPHHHQGVKLCSLDVSEKFHLFVDSTTQPVNFLGAAWDAGQSQLEWDDPTWGQGAAGYARRYAAATADNTIGDFLGIFVFPALFHQDPRYYRMEHGAFSARLEHALAHRFVTRGDSGNTMPNYSEWFGTVSSKALSNLYHPGNPRGFGPMASRVGFSVAGDMSWDVLREFWPQVARTCRLPFRVHGAGYEAGSKAGAPPVIPGVSAAPAVPANQ